MILPPRPVTLRRWWKISAGRNTLLRSLEYEYISGLRFTGKTLDVGGGKEFLYQQILHITGELYSININPNLHPTVVADLNSFLPFHSASFDNVISFNTLEHIREDQRLIGEVLRVLKPGGTFLITIPFLFPVHGSPHDFHRHTACWWEDILMMHGVATEDFTIESLVWSPLSSALAQLPWFRAGLLGGTIKRLILLFEVLRQAVLKRDSTQEAKYVNFALGYYIVGSKSRT